MKFVMLTNRETGFPVLINLDQVEFVVPAGESGSNVVFGSRNTGYVRESLEQIQTLASDHSTLASDHSTLASDHSTLVHGDPYAALLRAEVSVASVTQGEAASVTQGEAGPVPEGEPPAKPGSKRETK